MRRFVVCVLVTACGARTELLSGTHSDADALGGAGGSGEHTAGSGGGSLGVGAHGGLGGASVSAGTGGALFSAGGTSGVSGRAGSAGDAESAGQSGDSNAAGAGGEAGAPECPPCVTPPPKCIDAHTVRRFGAGQCSAGACQFASTDSPCLTSCQDGACLPFAASISQGETSACATVNHGPLKCWGDTFNGLLGNGSGIGPTPVPGLETGVRLVSVGTRAACALMDSGDVNCFGLGFSKVTKVTGLPSDVTSVACASPYFDHTCVASPTAGVICWGSNNFGQLGNGLTTPSFTYQFEHVNVVGLAQGVVAVSAGSNDTCAMTGGGALWCWGMNRYGELGTGTLDLALTPAAVVGFSAGATAISAGEEYTCALTDQGAVRCWGWNATGHANALSPIDVAGVSDASALSVGGVAGCAVTRSGALKCWGLAAWNQLGTGSATDSYTQAVDPIGMSSGVVAVAVGEYGACDVLETGAVYCWGNGPGGAALPKQLAGF